jgi:hypothetical protein
VKLEETIWQEAVGQVQAETGNPLPGTLDVADRYYELMRAHGLMPKEDTTHAH